MQDFTSVLMCRVCESEDQLISLKDQSGKSIVKKLCACVDIQFNLNDQLPKYICNSCHTNLEFVYKFKIQCEYTDRKFRDALLKPPIKQELQSIEISPVIGIRQVDEVAYYEHTETLKNLTETLTENEIESIEENDATCSEVEYLADSVNNESFEDENTVDDNYDDDPQEEYENGNRTDQDHSEYEDKETVATENRYEQNTSDLEHIKQETDVTYNNEMDSDAENTTDEPPDAKQNTDKKQFQCDTCGQQFSFFSQFNLHKKSHGRFRYQCKICQNWFSKRYYLRTHERLHLGAKEFKCDTCGKMYTNQGNLDRHIRVTHKNERRHECEICNKTFSQISILNQHRAVHITERNFACDLCPKTFKTKEYLQLHRARHMPKVDRPRRTTKRKRAKPAYKPCVCTECGKISSNTTLHRSHMKTHSGERPYECKVCKKRFSFQQSLRNHAFVHTGARPFKCDECDMTFRQIGHLKGHKLVHSGKREHVCKECGKSFALRGNLTVHTRLHTGEQPYHCTLCPKKFYDSNGLRRHRIFHERRKGSAEGTSTTNKTNFVANQAEYTVNANNTEEIHNLFNDIIETRLTTETGDVPLNATDGVTDQQTQYLDCIIFSPNQLNF